MATSSAKSGKKSSSSSSTRKKTSASHKKQEEQSSDGLGLGTILNVVEQLAGSGSSSGKKKPKKSDESPLVSLLSSLTGGSDGGGVNYASIIELLLPMLLSNTKHTESFKSNPSKTIKDLTGVHVGDDHLGPIVEQVLSKLK